VTRLWAGRPMFEAQRGKVFSVPQNFQTVPGARPASHTLFTGGSFPGVKRPGREVYRPLTPFSAEVRNEWRYTGTATIYLYGMEGEGGAFLYIYSKTSHFRFFCQKVKKYNA